MEATTSSARSPRPNQASWRTATLPPARPMCRLASVVALRMTSPKVAPRSGQSTFCSRRRSMPTRTLIRRPGGPDMAPGPPTLGRAPAEPWRASGFPHDVSSADVERGDLLEEHRVVDLPRDGRRDLAAVTAALD